MTAQPREPAPDDDKPHLVHVPDADRAAYRRQPGDIVIGDAQLAGIARILGPVIEEYLAEQAALDKPPPIRRVRPPQSHKS